MNAMYPLDLIEVAERLIAPPGSRDLNQAELKTSIRISYYAVFSSCCENVADCLIGTSEQARSSSVWQLGQTVLPWLCNSWRYRVVVWKIGLLDGCSIVGTGILQYEGQQWLTFQWLNIRAVR